MRRSICVAFHILLLLLVSGCATPVADTQPVCVHENPSVELSIGYCQVVRVGEAVYISGVAGSGPMESALPRVYERLRRILETNGLTFGDVVKETVYATDLEAFIQASAARKAFYGSWLPAATWVQVQRLYAPSIVLEVEIIAHQRK